MAMNDKHFAGAGRGRSGGRVGAMATGSGLGDSGIGSRSETLSASIKSVALISLSSASCRVISAICSDILERA